MNHRVFICHAHQDYAAALAVCGELEAAGIGCWIAPRDVGPGAYAKQLVQAITAASVILLIFSEHANGSEHVLREIEIASDRNKIVIPVKIEQIKPNDDLEYFTKRVQWFEAIDPPLEQRLADIVQFVARLLAGVPDSAPKPATGQRLTATFAFVEIADGALLHSAVSQHGGRIFKTTGDTVCCVFSQPEDAVAGLLDAFSAAKGLFGRAAIHTGTVDERGSEYFGPAVDRVARLLAIAHDGQILASGVTQDLALGALPAQAAFKDLGAHRLNDLSRPEQVYQLVAPGLRADFPPLRSLSALPNNLPTELTSFVGRDREIADVTSLLAQHRLVTLAGSGGVGKTRLSLQVAANLLDGSGDGVWFIELAPLTDAALIPSTIASPLGLALAPEREPVAALVDALRSKTMLLVLDNCEHMVDAAAAVIGALLRGAPKITILASSRQSLGVSGEQTYRMPSLSVPTEAEGNELRAEQAREFGAIALFVERAIAADRRFALTDDNAPFVADIVRRLDGIALAIELAAPRVKMLDVRQLSKRLDERFRILTGGGRDVLPRQQTLRALIDWSYNLLDPREKLLLARLSVFVDGFTLEAATTVCTDDRIDEFDLFDLLSSLVDKSLVTAELAAESTRYRLLESTRAYALEKLDGIGDRERVADRHLDWVLAAATSAVRARDEDLRWEELEAIALEMDNVRAAVGWARESGRIDAGSAIIVALGSIYSLGFGGTEWLDRARAFIDVTPATESAILSQLWDVLARIAYELRLITDDLDYAGRSLDEARKSGDPKLVYQALLAKSNALVWIARFDESTRLLDEAAVGIATFAPFLVYTYHMSRALNASLQGDTKTSKRLYDTIIEQWRGLGAPIKRYTGVMGNLAEDEFSEGNVDRAIALARDAMSAQRGGGNHLMLANLAGYYLGADRIDEARAAATQSVSQFAADSGTSAIPIEHLALVAALAGDLSRAASLTAFVSRIYDEIGFIRDYTERVSYDRLRRILTESLAPDELERLEAIGRAYTWQQARDEAIK